MNVVSSFESAKTYWKIASQWNMNENFKNGKYFLSTFISFLLLISYLECMLLQMTKVSKKLFNRFNTFAM